MIGPSMSFSLGISPPLSSTLFPYTTLFRSNQVIGANLRHGVARADRGTGDVRGDHQVRQPHQRVVRRSEEHTSELQSLRHVVCRLLLEKKNTDDQMYRWIEERGVAHYCDGT